MLVVSFAWNYVLYTIMCDSLTFGSQLEDCTLQRPCLINHLIEKIPSSPITIIYFIMPSFVFLTAFITI